MSWHPCLGTGPHRRSFKFHRAIFDATGTDNICGEMEVKACLAFKNAQIPSLTEYLVREAQAPQPKS